jgi:carotenoid cleavage dioxygenase-like enzyme
MEPATESNPYLGGTYAPISHETSSELTQVVYGEIPRDLHGAYVRNGPNPQFAPDGRYHWFDGDGMLHAVRFEDGRAFYTNKYIRTAGYDAERAAGKTLWRGLREPIARERLPEPWKDTSNTDVKCHQGTLITSWYLSGKPYRIDPQTLETIGTDDFGGKWDHKVSAHVKIDERTGEMLFFDYGPMPPFMRYGVVDRHGTLVHSAEIPLSAPRLPHDMAHTDKYAILMDLSVFPDPVALAKGRWRSGFHPDVPSRFAVIPRRGTSADNRWFEASPCYIYHVVNAWDEDDAVVMIAHRVNPRCFLDVPPDASEFEKMMRNLSMDAELYRYRFDLRTGQTTEEQLDDRNTEFPSIDQRVSGRKGRYGYAMDIPRRAPLDFAGIVKYDVTDGTSVRYEMPAGVFCSESPFAPRVGSQGEDDGYLTTFVVDENAGTSELWVFDARELASGPACKLRLPHRVPRGFHACWVSGSELESARRSRSGRETRRLAAV